MSDHFDKEIAVSDLLLDPKNPRFLDVSNQVDAIKVMMDSVGEKIYNLASDIIENGLDPLSRICVTPNPEEEHRYIVQEGNRRILALKIMHNPKLLEFAKATTQKKFKKLSEKFLLNPIDHVSCVVYLDGGGNRWIKLKHTGENEGIGIVPWSSQAVDRFNQKLGAKPSLEIQAIDFMRECEGFPDDLKPTLEKIPITSLGRLLGDPDVRNILGVDRKDGILTSKLPPSEVAKGFTKIIHDLNKPEFNVNNIRRKEDRANYIKTFKNEEIPSRQKVMEKPWDLVEPATAEKAKPVKTGGAKPNPISKDRKTIITKKPVLKIEDARINKVYHELRKLDVNTFENAGAILFRVFLELSLDVYIKSKNIDVSVDSKLSKKAQKVAESLLNMGKISKHERKPIDVAVSNKDSIFSIDTFNAYVHNSNMAPKATDLKITWDNLKVFIEKLWENM